MRIDHELKVLPEFFKPHMQGRKPFTIRKNDRDFKVWDRIKKREWTPEGGYTGRYTTSVITYVTDYNQKEGFVIIALDSMVIGFDREGEK